MEALTLSNQNDKKVKRRGNSKIKKHLDFLISIVKGGLEKPF